MAVATLELDKENRPPRGMATSKGSMTPGRRRKAQDQYFDVGKVGRKTGITLPDKGVRDEYGMEPMSGIFSSPIASPQHDADHALDRRAHEQSPRGVEHTPHLRRTPRLPTARAATPRHTNIGSPKRMSTGRPHTTGQRKLPMSDDERSPERTGSRTQPPANRKLSFGGEKGVRKSIESLSPFRPKNALRRSLLGPHADPFGSPDRQNVKPHVSPSGFVEEEEEEVEEDEVEEEVREGPTEVSQMLDDAPLFLDVDDDGYQPTQYETTLGVEEVEADEDRPQTPSEQRLEDSHGSVQSSGVSQSQLSRHTTPSKKRDRISMESQEAEDANDSLEPVGITSESPAAKKQRGRPPKTKVTVHRENDESTIDPSLLAQGDDGVEDVPRTESVQPPKRGKGRKGKPAAPKERDANRNIRAQTSPAKLYDGPSRGSQSPSKRAGSRAASTGPVSNMSLRATTPFEDAVATTRSGRPVLKPLQYWANETRVWKHGEVEGIIRAEEVAKPKPHGNKGRKKGRKAKRATSNLDDIDEESETESTMADEWEELVGVIAGTVANWDPETQMGNPHDPIHEDLAFASSAIVTRDVAGSEFKYAKIMSMPFFGSGIVELPPEGFKRAKNSRKMQMCFFVHEGKVMVEVGGQSMHDEVNQFAISKGGAWVVPRGNNYAITNESRTKTAKVFFAQGSEIAALASAAE